jgi:hypothetical protein
VANGLRLVARGSRLRAREDVGCFASHVSETCADLWDAPVSIGGAILQIGPRVYARAATAP